MELKYCRKHDLTFCSDHVAAGCFDDDCVLTDAPDNPYGDPFCSVCMNVLNIRAVQEARAS